MQNRFVREMWEALGGRPALLERVRFTGNGALPSAFPVTDFAAGAIAAASLSIAELLGRVSPAVPDVVVDRRLASFWFGWSIRPVGWAMPSPWDPIAGDYRTKDGWIRLHTNAPHHHAAAERILGQRADKAAMAKAVAAWAAGDLEAAIVDAGGCAAEMRSLEAWAAHPQGRALASEPLVESVAADRTGAPPWTPRPDRPLAGLKVLDLTRVLAGPVASRFLAGHGADVLRIDPPDWDEPGTIPEVTLGKRCARLNLQEDGDRRVFERLLAGAHVLLHGYRPGALDRLGYGRAARQAIAPGLVDVSLDAYGWSGPWAGRRGFDSLVQMSAGIAHAGMAWKGVDVPIPLPVQALDHATGYLMAAATVRALGLRIEHGRGASCRLSLARTAGLLVEQGGAASAAAHAPQTDADFSPTPEHTPWGEARRLRPPAEVAGAAMHWERPASALGSTEPAWA